MRLRLRRIVFFVSMVTVACVSAAGCGDDDPATVPDKAETGTGDSSSTADRSVVAPDTSRSETSTTADARSPEYTGSACTVASECYGGLDAASLKGAPYCLDRVTDGYCTHECQTDDDCCAIPGECRTTLKQRCGPFESTGKRLCFLSCENADLIAARDAGLSDAGTNGNDFCHNIVSSEFGCRSTGGGSDNVRVCVPTGGGGNDGGTNDAGQDAGSSDAADASDALDASNDSDG